MPNGMFPHFSEPFVPHPTFTKFKVGPNNITCFIMAEIALAAVSFSFQVFSGCIQGRYTSTYLARHNSSRLVPGYQLLSEALGLPEEYQYVRVRIKNEQFRLLDWACVVRVSESDSSLVVGRAGKAMVLDILEQQHNLLHRFGRFDERLKPVSKPLLSDVPFQAERAITDTVDENDRLVKFPKSAELYQRALKYIRSTRTLPTRLRWIACDKTKIETLLVKITSLNDTLTELLNKDQLDKLLELQVRPHLLTDTPLMLTYAEGADALWNHATQLLCRSTGEHHQGGKSGVLVKPRRDSVQRWRERPAFGLLDDSRGQPSTGRY